MRDRKKFYIYKSYLGQWYGGWCVILPDSLWGEIGNTHWCATWREAIRFVDDLIRRRKNQLRGETI